MAPRPRGASILDPVAMVEPSRLRALTALSTFACEEPVKAKAKSAIPPWRFLLTACTVSLTGTFHFGWSLGTTNNAAVVIKAFINESIIDTYGLVLSACEFNWVWSFYVSSMFLAAPIGTQAANVLSVKYGRWRTLLACGMLSIVGLAHSLLAYYLVSFELLLLSRIIVGIMIGGSCVQFVYMAEMSPPEWRGLACQMSASMIPLGEGLAVVFTAPYLLGTTTLWHYMFVIELAVALVQLALFYTLCDETPAYQLASKTERELENETEFVDRVVATVQVQHSVTRLEAAATVQQMRAVLTTSATSDILSVRETFKNPRLRSCLVIAMWMALGNVISGLSVITAFSTQLLHDYVHFDAMQSSNFTALMLFTGFLSSAGLASYMVERWGRRPLYMASTASLFVLYVLMFSSTTLYESTDVSAMAYVFMVSEFAAYHAFIMGVGPISLYITTELLPDEAKSSAQSATQGWMRFLSGIAVLVFPPLESVLGSYIFLVFAVPLAFLTVYVYAVFPETKGKAMSVIVAECNRPIEWPCRRRRGNVADSTEKGALLGANAWTKTEYDAI